MDTPNTTRIRVQLNNENGENLVFTFNVLLDSSYLSCPDHIGGCPRLIDSDLIFCWKTRECFIYNECLFDFSVSDRTICTSHPSFFTTVKNYEEFIKRAIRQERLTCNLMSDVKIMKRRGNGNKKMLQETVNKLYNLHIKYGIYLILEAINMRINENNFEDEESRPEIFKEYHEIFYPILTELLSFV
jgi:hypothetical protein